MLLQMVWFWCQIRQMILLMFVLNTDLTYLDEKELKKKKEKKKKCGFQVSPGLSAKV